MKDKNELRLLLSIGFIAVFAALSFIATTLIRIPIPATGGYFNIGDTFIMISALLYGPIIAFFVGLIGPTLSDAIGFPQFILATAIVKSMEGLLIGMIGFSKKKTSPVKTVIALIVGIMVIVMGYYLFEAYIYPLLAHKIPFFGVTDKAAALAEILPNLIQGIFSALIAFGIWKVFRTGKDIY